MYKWRRYTLHKINENMGEYGSVKTHTPAYLMQWNKWYWCHDHMKIQSNLYIRGTLITEKWVLYIKKAFTSSKSHLFITIYFINHIFYLLLTSFHGSLFLSYRDAIFVSRIVIKRMQGFRMNSKGLHMLCWLNMFSE